MAALYGSAPLQAAVAFLLAELDRLPSPPSPADPPQSVPQPSAKPAHADSKRGRTNTAPVAAPLPPPRPSDLLDNAAIVDAICRLVQRVERVQPQQLFHALLDSLPPPAAAPTTTTCQSLANQLDCLHSLLGQAETEPDRQPQAGEHSGRGQATVDRLAPLLSAVYVSVHSRVVRLLLALNASLPAVRLPLQQLVTQRWLQLGQTQPSAAPSAPVLSFRLPLSVLCELSCGLLAADGDAAFATSLQIAVLSCLLSHPQPSSRLVIIRRMLAAFLAPSSPSTPAFARHLLTVLSERWYAAVSPASSSASASPLLLASDGATVLGLLSFPAVPSLSSLSAVHPLLLDVYTVLCLYFDALASSAQSADEWQQLLLSVCSVGLSSSLLPVNKQSAFLLRKHAAASSHTAAPPTIAPSAWLTYLSILDALRTNQTHFILSRLPRLHSLSLPAVFIGLLVDKALSSSTRLPCALQLITAIPDTARSSHSVARDRWDERCCRFADVIPAVLSGPFLRFLNSSHGELSHAPPVDSGADDSFPAQVRRLLSSYFLSLSDASDGGPAAQSPRAVFMRHWLAATDATLSSHLALRQQLTVLSALPPLPAYTNDAYLHILSLLSTRVSVASGRLRPQLVPLVVTTLCRHTAFNGATESAACEGVSFGRWCEALSLLPLDTFVPRSALHSMLSEAMSTAESGQWLDDNIVRAWTEWLGLDEHEQNGSAAPSDTDVSPVLTSASRLSLAFSLANDSSTAAQRCVALLSRALGGCYSRTHQSAVQRVRALALLAYCLPTVLSPVDFSPVLPSVLGLPACHLPGAVVIRSTTHGSLSAAVSSLSDELLALCDATLQEALVDEQQAQLYRALVVPLLYSLFVGFPSVAAVTAYRQKLLARVTDALVQAESVSSHAAFGASTSCDQFNRSGLPLVPTALLTVTAALTVALLHSSTASQPPHKLLGLLGAIDLGRRPAAASGTEWASLVEQLHAYRFTALRHLLLSYPPNTLFTTDGASSVAPIFHHCLDALDSAADSYLPIVYDCLRLLLPALVDTASATHDLDTVFSLLLSRAQSGFAEEVRDESFTLAYVSLLFAPTLFAHPSLHSSPSALYRRLLPQLVTYSQLHPRFAYYLSSFTAVLFSLFPRLTLPYVPVVVALSTYQAGDSRQEEEQVRHALAAYQLAHLTHNMAADDECAVLRDEHVVGKGDTMTRLAALLYIERCIAALGSTSAGGETYPGAVQSVLVELLQCVLAQPILRESNAETVSGSSPFIAKVYTLQTLCILTRALPVLAGATRAALVAQVLSLAWEALVGSTNSITRHLVEVCLSSVFISFPALLATELLPRFKLYSSRPTLLASLVVITGYATVDTAEPERLPALLPVVLTQLFPVLSSQYGHTRLVAQFWYWRLYTAAVSLTPPALPFASPADVAPLRLMYEALDGQADVVKLREKQLSYFAAFHPVSKCSVRGILADASDAYSLLPAPLLGRAQHLVTDFLSNLRLAYDQHYELNRMREAPLAQTQPAGTARGEAEETVRESVDGEVPSAEATAADDGDENYQQKFGLNQVEQLRQLYDSADGDNAAAEEEQPDNEGELALLDEDDEAEDEVQQRRRHKHKQAANTDRQRQSLITPPTSTRAHLHTSATTASATASASRSSLLVAASLVASAPNLAGLTRSCEIFGVHSLSLPSFALLDDPLYLRVSVSSHRWLPLREVPASQLLEDVRRLRAEGYRVVALEQTAHSVQLTEYEWAERSVLVLGGEREGVPVDVLNEVDECVVIPQQGVIRSLNVHVAASVAIFEYNRQRAMRKRQQA